MRRIALLTILSSMILAGWVVRAKAQTEADLQPFPAFREKLETALKEHGVDPQRQTFHFVVMMNTVRTEGLGAQQMRNVYYGILKHYLIAGTDNIADKISFIPYQLKVRETQTAWNRPFAYSAVGELYKLPPTAPESQAGGVSGHDSEAAILASVERAEPTESCVYLLLSDGEVSASPRDVANYTLTGTRPEFARTMSDKGVEEVSRGRFTADYPRKPGDTQTYYATMYYRIYLPKTLKPLASLPQKTRTQLISEAPADAANTAVPANPAGSTTGKPAVSPQPAPTNTPKPEPESAFPLPLILGVLVLLAVVVAGGLYFAGLNKPRNFQVNNVTGTVRKGQRLYLGGPDSGKNVLTLPEVAKGQKIAALEVDGSGKVILRGEGLYTFQGGTGAGKLQLKPTPQTVTIRNTHTKETVCQLNVKTIA